MMRKDSGFTLIEVLIALAILAIALVAVIKATGQSVNEAVRIKQKLAAHWVAMNALARVQTGLINLSEEASPSGDENMLGLTWHWQMRQENKSESAGYVRVKITVTQKNKSRPLESLLGFVRYPDD